jgi:hypothetical protein
VPIPPSPVLRAALRWLEHLPASKEAQIRALFAGHRSYADVTPTQYAAAYEWLQDHGLLKRIDPGAASAAIFEAAIADSLWFADSDVLVPDPDSLPEDGVAAAEVLNISPPDAFALLKHCWGKVDVGERSRIGSAGELALMALLDAVPEIQVRHVAAQSDGFGYDISAEADRLQLHIEVKSTTRRGRLSIYLSRNEFETMQRDNCWVLAAVRLDADMNVACVATVLRKWIAAAAPRDSPGGRWESVKLDVPPDALIPGVHPLAIELPSCGTAILRGIPSWPG